MDDLKQRIEESRTFWHKVGHINFRCRMPSQLAVIAASDRPDEHFLETNHRLLMGHVVGWSDATGADLGQAGDAKPVIFEKWAFDMWAADHVKEASALLKEIMDRFRARNDAQEASLKNS